jgi:predicted PurR-regulated permease PerM
MELHNFWPDRFRRFIINNKFVLLLVVLLLVGLNILVFSQISFVLYPLELLIKTIILPITLAGILFYLLNPLVDGMERWGIQRGWSIMILYLLIAGILTVVVLAVIPLLRNQTTGLITNLPTYSQNVGQRIEALMGSQLYVFVEDMLNTNSDEWWNSTSQKITEILNHTWTKVGVFLGAFTDILLSLVIVPFVLFYMLKDGKKLPQKITSFFPTKSRPALLQLFQDMSRQISSYIRGQIIVSLCIGVLLYVGYMIIGLEYALTFAVIASLTSVVPFLGPAIAITPALIVALVTSPIMLLKMVAVWTIAQFVEGKFITPQIMGKSLQIHPITIIFVILTAGKLFGVVGILLAVPGFAVLKVCIARTFQWFTHQTGWYDLPGEKE